MFFHVPFRLDSDISEIKNNMKVGAEKKDEHKKNQIRPSTVSQSLSFYHT